MSEISDNNYWQFGKDWNELKANEGHDGIDITTEEIEEMKKQNSHGIIAIWNDEQEGNTFEDAHIIEW